jgi:hypothetical protein
LVVVVVVVVVAILFVLRINTKRTVLYIVEAI